MLDRLALEGTRQTRQDDITPFGPDAAHFAVGGQGGR